METPPERHSFTHHFLDLGRGGEWAAALALVKVMVIDHWTRPLSCCPDSPPPPIRTCSSPLALSEQENDQVPFRWKEAPTKRAEVYNWSSILLAEGG